MIGRKEKKELNKENICKAAIFLRKHILSNDAVNQIDLELAIRTGPEWYAEYHFGWGMDIRNLLRKNGFGEKELGVRNLDDIYVPLLEFVVSLRKINDIFFLQLAQGLLINTISGQIESAAQFYKLQELGELN